MRADLDYYHVKNRVIRKKKNINAEQKMDAEQKKSRTKRANMDAQIATEFGIDEK